MDVNASPGPLIASYWVDFLPPWRLWVFIESQPSPMRSSSVLCDVIGCFTNIRFLPHCVFTCHSNSCLPATFSQGQCLIHQHCSAWLVRELERGPRAFHTQTHSTFCKHCIQCVCVRHRDSVGPSGSSHCSYKVISCQSSAPLWQPPLCVVLLFVFVILFFIQPK